MNKQQRKQLSAIREKLDDMADCLEAIQGEEQDKLYNLPDSLQFSSKGDTFQDAIDALGEAIDNVRDAVAKLDEF